MSINILFLADPHLCVQARRRNVLSLQMRKPWKYIDVDQRKTSLVSNDKFSPFKPASYDDRPLLAAADLVGLLADDLDMLVLLGDLATTGTSEDLEVAREVFLDARTNRHLNAALEPRFGGLGISTHVIPGNHDRYRDIWATPGGDQFDKVFGSVYRPTNGVSSETIKKGNIKVGLISADFCYAAGTKLKLRQKYGWGIVDPTILAELETQTKDWQSENPNFPVLWALHFSPGEGVSSDVTLENRELLIDLSRKLGVKHIFCGHTHLRKREIGTHPHIYCAGSVSAVDSRNSHFLHVCSVSKTIDAFNLEVHDFKYDEKRDAFISSPVSKVA